MNEPATPQTAELVLRTDEPGETISRMIYGHFAEHLGRCVYGGIWVGEDSPIPNTRGIRTDVVKPVPLEGIAVEGGRVRATLPPKSVVVLTLRPPG